MRVRRTLLVLLLVALLVWGIETISLMWRSAGMPSRLKAQAEGERRALRIQFREKERRLNDEYRAKKYLATGQTVYDRIFNTPEQTLPELIERTALESVPNGWDCEVRVEEFSHFILLIYLPANAPSVEASDVMV